MPPEDNLIKIQISKEVTALFKFFLEESAELEKDPQKYAELRKKILSHGNDAIRNLVDFIDYFDFQINTKKVEEASHRKIVYKKTMFSAPIVLE